MADVSADEISDWFNEALRRKENQKMQGFRCGSCSGGASESKLFAPRGIPMNGRLVLPAVG